MSSTANNRAVNRPDQRLLHRVLPKHIWDAAEKQAHRSNLGHFSAGAVIFKGNDIISRGCSHPSFSHSYHAEEMALERIPTHISAGAEALVVTVFLPTGGWSYSSRPCAKCARILHKKGVEVVHYAYKDKDERNGVWSIRTESVADLAEASYRHDNCVNHQQYGSQMYLSGIDPINVEVAV